MNKEITIGDVYNNLTNLYDYTVGECGNKKERERFNEYFKLVNSDIDDMIDYINNVDLTYIGKISNVKFGLCDYTPTEIGITIDLSFDNRVISYNYTEVDLATKVSEIGYDIEMVDYMDGLVKIIKSISKLLRDANVTDIQDLVDIPIEVTLNDNKDIESWRILTEVL